MPSSVLWKQRFLHGLVFGSNEKAEYGDPIVLMGYPGGVEMLASRIPDDLLHEIYRFSSSGFDETAQLLAEHSYIQPLAVDSRISGQTENRIFFETLLGSEIPGRR